MGRYEDMVRNAHAERAVAIGEAIGDLLLWFKKVFLHLTGRG